MFATHPACLFARTVPSGTLCGHAAALQIIEETILRQVADLMSMDNTDDTKTPHMLIGHFLLSLHFFGQPAQV